MPKGKVYISDYPEDVPKWYWKSGLHDACIMGVESFEFHFDYNKFVDEKNKCNRNLITFKINYQISKINIPNWILITSFSLILFIILSIFIYRKRN